MGKHKTIKPGYIKFTAAMARQIDGWTAHCYLRCLERLAGLRLGSLQSVVYNTQSGEQFNIREDHWNAVKNVLKGGCPGIAPATKKTTAAVSKEKAKTENGPGDIQCRNAALSRQMGGEGKSNV